jgi:hypothetical protein
VIPFTRKSGSPPETIWRGGIILLVGSGLLMACWWQKGRGLSVLFCWLLSLWLIFPIGAWLGLWLPKAIRGKSRPCAVLLGMVIGCLVGLVLAVAILGMVKSDELIGLLRYRHSGGYASYHLSVLNGLRAFARQMLFSVVPIMTGLVAAWAGWEQRQAHRVTAIQTESTACAATIQLRFGSDHWRILLGLASLVAIGMALVILIESRNPLLALVVVPMGASLTVVGPWLGPLYNPGGGHDFAVRLAGVGLPCMGLALLPFMLIRQPVSPRLAAVVWTGYATAILFWFALGVMSMGWSMG